MPLRRRRSVGRRSPRRKLEWQYGFGASVGAQSFGTQTLVSHWALWPVGLWDDTMQSFPGETVTNPTDLTLVRSINDFYAWIQNPGVGFDYTVHFGMGLIKFAHPSPDIIDGAALLSNDQVPGPVSTPTFDWVWRLTQFTRVFGDVSATMFTADITSAQSRAMRKLSHGEGLLQILELNILGAPFDTQLDIAWGMESRLLLKEA